MNAASRFLSVFLLAALALPGVPAAAASRPASAAKPKLAPARQRARQLAAYLTGVLHLNAKQAARLRVPVLRRVMQRDSLARQPFANAAAASAAYTVVEYNYYTALVGVLTPGQYSALMFIDEQAPSDGAPAPMTAAR